MRLGIWALLVLMLAGCSDKVGYQAGMVTREVTGQVSFEEASGETPFVLVRMHGATFIKNSDGTRLTRPSARLVYPDSNGRYRVYLDDEVNRVDLYYIARGTKPAQASFERTLGVSAYQFDISLKKDAHWHKGYYIGLKPILSGYITEPRYKMPPKDQLFLGDWMSETENRLDQKAP